MFTRWAHRHRKLYNLTALRESKDVVDIRHERKLRYDFAKLKAKGRLNSLYKAPLAEGVPNFQPPAAYTAPVPRHDMSADLPATPPTSAKRYGSPPNPEHDV